MTRRRWITLATALAGCSGREKSGRPLKLLRVGIANSAHSVAPLFLADEQGNFRAEGLEIEIERSTFTGLHVSAVAAGKLDVALVAMNPALLNAVILGAPVRLVAARKYGGAHCGAWGQLFARLASFPGRLADFREVEGKRIGYSTPGSISDFCLDVLVDAAGISRARVKAVVIKRQEAVAALVAGSLDAVINVPSLIAIPDERRSEFGYLPGAERIYPEMQISYTAFGERLRGEDRLAGIAFLRAFARASDDFRAGASAEFNRRWALENGFDPEAMIEQCPHEATSDGSVDAKSVGLFVDWAVRKKHVERAIDPERLIDRSVIRDLNRGAKA